MIPSFAYRVLLTMGAWSVAATLVLLVAWTATLLTRRNAALRHLIWLSAFAVLLFIPVFSIFSAPAHPFRTLAAPPVIDPVRESVQTSAPAYRLKPPVSTTMPTQVSELPSAVVHASTVHRAPAFDPRPAGLGMVILWLAGAICVGLWAIAALVGVRLVYGNSTAGDGHAVGIRGLASRLKVGRNLNLRLSREASPPTAMTWGAFRPVVLLPRDAANWTRSRLEAVLLHEIAHVRRFDYVSQIFSVLVCAIYWYNPIVWVCARAMRQESETASDDAVVRAGVSATDYAVELLSLAAELGGRRQPRLCMGVSLMKRSRIEARIKSIVDPGNRRAGLNWTHFGSVLAGGTLLAFLLICVRPSIENREKTRESLYDEALFVLTLHERSVHQSGFSAERKVRHGTESFAWHAPLAERPSDPDRLAIEIAKRETDAKVLAANRSKERVEKELLRLRRQLDSDQASKGQLSAARHPELALNPRTRSSESQIIASHFDERSGRLTAGQLIGPGGTGRIVEPGAPNGPETAQHHMRLDFVSKRALSRQQILVDARPENLALPVARVAPRAIPVAHRSPGDPSSLVRSFHSPEAQIKLAAERVALDSRSHDYTYLDLPTFTRIQADAGVHVRFVTGPVASVRFRPEGSPERVTATVSERVLHLTASKFTVIEVATPRLKGIDLKGGASGIFSEIGANEFSVHLDGQSAAIIEGPVRNLSVQLDGCSNLSIPFGGAHMLSGSVNGSSFLGVGGTVQGVSITENGSSTIKLDRLAARNVSASVDGSSRLMASGCTQNLHTVATGNSTLSMVGLNAQTAVVSAAGSSQITIGTSDSLQASANGASRITYKGNPCCLCKSPTEGSSIEPF